jgi:hypothetical protein
MKSMLKIGQIAKFHTQHKTPCTQTMTMKNGGGGKSSLAKQTLTPTTNQRMKMKYPRTLQEAFPKTVEYGASIEIHVARHSTGDKIIRVLALIGAIVLALDVFIWRP